MGEEHYIRYYSHRHVKLLQLTAKHPCCAHEGSEISVYFEVHRSVTPTGRCSNAKHDLIIGVEHFGCFDIQTCGNFHRPFCKLGLPYSARMVSVFEGQLTRTWAYEVDDKKHVLNLYHDTISGVRSASLDFQEIRGSYGNSSLLMDSKGHRIFFTIGNLPGYLEIKRSGWTGFEYGCVINDKVIKEVTQGVPENQDLLFQPKILETIFTADEQSDYSVAWYVIHTRRITDGVTTTVHRRFREFAELNSQVKQNMKGHHLRDVLPPLPEKTSKHFFDHKDLNFIQERTFKLETFLCNMVSIPHVANMICMKAFLGIMDKVREYSLTFHVPTLGMSLLPTERQGDTGASPCVVGLIQKPEVCTGVLPGDSLSRVNGMPLGGSSFKEAIARIRGLPRPIIIHFVTVLGSRAGAASLAAAARDDRGVRVNVVGGALDEVATTLAAREENSKKSKPVVLYEGDLHDPPLSAARNSRGSPAGWDGDYGQGTNESAAGYEDGPATAQVVSVEPLEDGRHPQLRQPAVKASGAVTKGAQQPNALPPVEFVDVDIVDAPRPPTRPQQSTQAQRPASTVTATAKVGSVAPSSSAAASAASAAGVRPRPAPATSSTTAATVSSAPATSAASSSASRGGLPSRGPVSVAATTTPVAVTVAAATAPVPAPAPERAVASPSNPNGLGGVRPRPVPQQQQSGSPASDQGPATGVATSAAKQHASPVPPVQPTVVRNRSVFDDPPADSRAATTTSPSPDAALKSPDTSAGSPGWGKSSLFSDEVEGFAIKPVPVSAQPAPVSAAAPVRRPAPRPTATAASTNAAPAGAAAAAAAPKAPVTQAVVRAPAGVGAVPSSTEKPSVAATSASTTAPTSTAATVEPTLEPTIQPATTQPANLLGWD